MIIAFRSKFPLESVFTSLIWALVILCGLSFFYFLMSRASMPIMVKTHVRARGQDLQKPMEVCVGPLALKENSMSVLALSLEKKLSLLAQSGRPDVAQSERVFCIGIEGSDQRRQVKEGEPLFLYLAEDASGRIESISFADEGVAAYPLMVDASSIRLRVGDVEALITTKNGATHQVDGVVGIDSLSQAKWLGKDRLFEKYGGRQYQTMAQKEKIELIDSEGAYFLFVSKGDYLGLEDEKWSVLESLEQADASAPLAHVVSVDTGELVLEAWDDKGFFALKKTLKLEKLSPLGQVQNQLIADARMRTAKQVSCQMEKQRVILKEGDWLLKGKSGWNKLKTLEEIEAYLDHQLLGDLFVVDAIAPSGQIRGSYFDAKRTQTLPITLAVSQKPQNVNRNPARPRRARGHLSKL